MQARAMPASGSPRLIQRRDRMRRQPSLAGGFDQFLELLLAGSDRGSDSEWDTSTSWVLPGLQHTVDLISPCVIPALGLPA
jgi:hypothetical protein